MTKSFKIAIVARGLSEPPSGPKNYLQGFAEEFIRQATPHIVWVYYNSTEFLGHFPRAVEKCIPVKNKFLWDHLLLPYYLWKDHIDLVIFPKGTISFWMACRAAVIILDLGYFYPELHAYKPLDTLYMRFAMKFAARHSQVVFTISEHTRQDVIRLLNVSSEKVINILGAPHEQYDVIKDQELLERVRQKYNLYAPFIFYPTNISPRKNFTRLLDAFETIQAEIPHHLYVTGHISWNAKDVKERLRGPISARVHQLGTVPVEDMAALYSLAEFSIYPSLFEGLGLPVLEGFRCGSPMLVSNQTSLPEVAGDAALIVDGYSTDSIAQGLLQMALDPGLRSTLREKGFARAKEFTWQKTVQIVMDWINSHPPESCPAN